MIQVDHAKIASEDVKNETSKMIVKSLKETKFENYSKDYVKILIQFYEENWKRPSGSVYKWYYYVYKEGKQNIYGSGAVDNHGQIQDVIVDINHRRNGIGRQIINHLENVEFVKRLPLVYVICDTNSVGFYQKLGYTEKERIDKNGNIEVKMEKSLSKSSIGSMFGTSIGTSIGARTASPLPARKILFEILWRFTSKVYESEEEFSKAVRQYQIDIKKKDSWNPNQIVITEPSILLIRGNMSTEAPMSISTKNPQGFTALELLFKTHNLLAGKGIGKDDHHFFEGFNLVAGKNVYRVHLGS